MKNELISIIIPIYNIEKYLQECLQSVISQKYRNIEIIVINDGSTDNSKAICDEFAKLDSRIKIISEENQGVSHARNVGIENAIGDYIYFVDADDYLENNLLIEVSQVIQHGSITCFGYCKVYQDKKVENVINANEITDFNELIEHVYCDERLAGFLWNKVFDADIIKRNGIKFNESIHYCEDMLFIEEYLKYCSNYTYITKGLYNYRMRKSSATFELYNKKNATIIQSFEKLYDINSNNSKIQETIALKYYFESTRFKRYIQFTRNDIIEKAKRSSKSTTFKIKIFMVKNFPLIYRLLKKVKNRRLRLFD